MNQNNRVLIRPITTEKSSDIKETENKYIFEVNRNSNKIDVKRAVEEFFKVKVESVNTFNIKGKKKRVGAYQGKCSDWKKAVVQLKKGDTIKVAQEKK
ncbi:MAG: 50S ribosomal protein L23 [Elusimicrobiota bacterium]